MRAFYSPLTSEALLHIRGPDALTFLQGQLTCDTRQMGRDSALPGAYCTPQGRVVCDVLMYQLADQHFALRLRRDIRQTSAETLARYIVFSKAELEPERDDWRLTGYWGADAGALLAVHFGEIPRGAYAAVTGEGFVLVQLDEVGERFECLHLEGVELTQNADNALVQGSEVEWRRHQIHAGTARVEAATSGEFTPQMLNYDLTGHVSFTKGCYTGQEVVARLHYRGQSKRRLQLGTLDARSMPPPALVAAGGNLYRQGRERSVATVINSAEDSDRGVSVLFVATVEDSAAGLHAGADDGPQLQLCPMPYPVESGS